MSERAACLVMCMGGLLLLGCFVDDGSQSSVGQETMATTQATTTSETTTTGDATTASSTDEPTSSTTDASTTDEPTTGSGPCNGGDPICMPGKVEFNGETCGCGDMTRVCTDSGCGWSEWYCLGEDACAMWKFDEEEETWNGIRADSLLGNPPEGTIQVMFSLMSNETLVVVTDSEFYVFHTLNQLWSEGTPRDELFPEIGNAVLTSAISVNEPYLGNEPPGPAEDVFLTAQGNAWRYSVFANPLFATLQDSGPCCEADEDWQTSVSPTPGALNAGWFDYRNLHGWYPVDLGICDNEDEGIAMVEHSVYLANDSTVRIRDATACGEFVASLAAEEFVPFTIDGAPKPTMVGAASYLNGVYVVPEEISPP